MTPEGVKANPAPEPEAAAKGTPSRSPSHQQQPYQLPDRPPQQKQIPPTSPQQYFANPPHQQHTDQWQQNFPGPMLGTYQTFASSDHYNQMMQTMQEQAYIIQQQLQNQIGPSIVNQQQQPYPFPPQSFFNPSLPLMPQMQFPQQGHYNQQQQVNYGQQQQFFQEQQRWYRGGRYRSSRRGGRNYNNCRGRGWGYYSQSSGSTASRMQMEPQTSMEEGQFAPHLTMRTPSSSSASSVLKVVFEDGDDEVTFILGDVKCDRTT